METQVIVSLFCWIAKKKGLSKKDSWLRLGLKITLTNLEVHLERRRSRRSKWTIISTKTVVIPSEARNLIDFTYYILHFNNN